jgi:hypothetical protein
MHGFPVPLGTPSFIAQDARILGLPDIFIMHRFSNHALIAAILLFAFHAAPAPAQIGGSAGTSPAWVADCKALASVNFSKLQDAPTQIIDAQPVDARDKEPAYCRIRGYVAPQVGFELRLPSPDWNGKFIEMGCGGACGNTGWTFWCPLHRGYACIASDMGHRGKGQDMLWSSGNLQAQLDFDTRGPHVAALAGKAITERYYGKDSRKAYFFGCSNGGTQALAEAQRFPWDFDGIVDLAGVPSYSDMNAAYLWSVRALQDKAGRPLLNRPDLQLVHDAALARCDLDDGVKDGIIGDPYHCDFDPAVLMCKAGARTGCLDKARVEAVKKVYSGPITSTGVKASYIRGFAPGSELGWVDDDSGLDSVNSNRIGGLEEWALEVFRYMAFMPAAGPQWTLADFDFDRDYKRLGVSETLWGASNPDLRKFRSAGGKLIMVQGWNDQNVVPAGQVDYYETVERTMGGRSQTQAFFRLFMVPGMNHCTGGDGAFAIDYLTYLEAWVERGKAPDVMIGAHVLGTTWGQSLKLTFPLDRDTPIGFTRPVYPYPLRAKYKGAGDPNDAANFESVQPER